MKFNKNLLMSAVIAAFVAQAQATEFRSADTHNADDYPTVAAVKYMGELLEKKSAGKHKIKVFNKQALGSEKETIDQVKIGALDFTRVNVGPMNGICPLTQVPTMPFLFNSIAHMRKSLDGPVGDEILKSCEAVGFVGLAFYDSGARSIYAKKPIKTVADAKGLKNPRPAIRFVGGLDQRDGRQRHADALRRSADGSEDRPDRRGRKQHPVVRHRQAP